jgi:hypothetical protein
VWEIHTNDGQNVTSSLVIVWVDTLDGGVVSVLALVRVLEQSEEHVNDIDEDISADHALPEVPRVTHLGQKVEEEHGSTVSVDDGIDTLVSTKETSATRCVSVRRSASESPDRNGAFNCAVGEVQVTVWSASTAEGAEHSRIVRARGGTDTDSHKGNDDGRPDGEVGKPSETLKCTNLAKDHTEDGDDEEADDEAKSIAMHTVFANGNLGYRSTKTENKHGHQHEHLETLQNVDNMSHFLTEDTEEGLSKITERVPVGIHVHVDAPDVPARNGSHETKNGVQSSTRPVTSVGESPSKNWLARSLFRKLRRVLSLLAGEQCSRCTTGTENIGGDQEEDGTPGSRSCGTGSLSPLEVGDSGKVVVGCYHSVSVDYSINFMDMALGESILDNATERPRILPLDEVALIFTLFSTGNLRIVKVLLEQDRSVVVDLRSLNAEAMGDFRLMAMIESVLSWVLLPHTRVTTIEGEVGKVLGGHVDRSGSCAGVRMSRRTSKRGGGVPEYVLEPKCVQRRGAHRQGP